MTAAVNDEKVKLPFFERYLSLWVILCIVSGIIIGKVFPSGVNFLGKLEIAHVNIPAPSSPGTKTKKTKTSPCFPQEDFPRVLLLWTPSLFTTSASR